MEPTSGRSSRDPGVSGTVPGELIVIATPIGNLGDVSERARTTLGGVDLLCCEDTRVTGHLLDLLGIVRPKLTSLHEHNEHHRVTEIVEALTAGARVGLVSDAGTPLLSDPGSRLVAAAAAAGVTVTSVPGATAVITGVVVSGLGGGRFRFEGFLPRKGRARSERLAAIVGSSDPVVIYEAPGRVAETIAELAGLCLPERKIAVARELTKRFEETWRGPITDGAKSHPVTAARGEYVLVLDGVADDPTAATGPEVLDEAMGKLATAGLSRRDAAAATEALLGVTSRAAYDAALAHQGFQ